MIKLNEMDEHTQEALQQIAAVMNTNVQEVVEKWGELWQAVSEALVLFAEKIGDIVAELPNLPRPPAEIKKDIKHEKNPMRLRQLNKELNESYKAYKRK